MSNGRIQKLRQRWDALQPSKTTLVWACAGSVALTLIIGFTWGGWVTGGKADTMAATAGEEARSELASVICVENFLAGPNAGARLAELKELKMNYKQRQFVEEAGWATMPKAASANRQAADLCAKALATLEMDAPEATLQPMAEPVSAVQ